MNMQSLSRISSINQRFLVKALVIFLFFFFTASLSPAMLPAAVSPDDDAVDPNGKEEKQPLAKPERSDGALPEALGKEVKRSVVKIFTSKQAWQVATPWTKGGLVSTSGTGFFIEKNRILTNAHVVDDATFIQFQFSDIDEKYEAELVAVNHETDLALLKPGVQDGLKVRPVVFGKLPRARDKVVSVGFPLGGEQMNYNEGVVSRIVTRPYAHSGITNMIVQTDAAINSGNSGGPVFSAGSGLCLGVAAQKMSSQDRIGYFIPIPVVKQFLDDLTVDGKIDGIPTLGIIFQQMENASLRKYYKMGERTGALIVDASCETGSTALLKKGDVLLSVDGRVITNELNVELEDDIKINLSGYININQIGKKVLLRFLRDGIPGSVEVSLKRYRSLFIIPVCPEYDFQIPYHITGGLVFSPLTKLYVQTVGLPFEINGFLNRFKGYNGITEFVVVVNVLSDAINRGYGGYKNDVVESVNGKKILSFNDFKATIAAAEGEFIVINLYGGKVVVLNRKACVEREKVIFQRYNVKQ